MADSESKKETPSTVTDEAAEKDATVYRQGSEYARRRFANTGEQNKMDLTPFLEPDITDIKETTVPELKRFCKGNFDVGEIYRFKAALLAALERNAAPNARDFPNRATQRPKVR